MKIVVTGGIGNVGAPMVERLIQNGHQVKVIDRRAGGEITGSDRVECDITNFQALKGHIQGQDAIIHLAGLADPNAGTGPEIFRVNCVGTYNIFEAAAQAGIQRVVCASSINAFGFNFGITRFPIQYFPIDEAHPGHTTDPYSFSKQILEEIAAYYWCRDGISSVCFRLPWVYQNNLADMWMGKDFFMSYKASFEKMAALPEDQRADQMRLLIDWHDEIRRQRVFEKPWDSQESPFNLEPGDPKLLMFFGWNDFWSVISADDSARAFELALTIPFTGSHALYVHEHENAAGIDGERLAQVFFPEVKARKRPIIGTECLVDMSRAQNLLGFKPQSNLQSLIFG